MGSLRADSRRQDGVLALPVEVAVINSKNVASEVDRDGPPVLSARQIDLIARQLDVLCRDVED